jgi:surfactin synthase thioesterase subunit
MNDDDLARALTEMGGTPPGVLRDPELKRWVLRTVRADFRALELATPIAADPFDLPIVAYGGRQDDAVSWSALEAWRTLTRREFTLRDFPGGHFFTQSHSTLLANALTGDIDSCLGNASGAPIPDYRTGSVMDPLEDRNDPNATEGR